MIQKKSGFTLVELLAVIVVVAIIITIAAVSVTSVLKKMKKSSSEEMRNNLKETAITYMLEKDIRLSKCSVSFSKEMTQGNITNLSANASCTHSLTVSDLKSSNLFEDARGYCKDTDRVIVYRYSDDGVNAEYRVYVDSQACTNIK